MNGDPPTENRASRSSRPARSARWALSLLDFDAHAVDQDSTHPFGVFIALCGHRLLMTGLHNEPPGGLCPGCSQIVVQRRVEGAAVRWARSPGDVRHHVVVGHHVVTADEAATGWVRTLCGTTLSRANLDLAAQPSSPLCSWCVTGARTEPPPRSGGT